MANLSDRALEKAEERIGLKGRMKEIEVALTLDRKAEVRLMVDKLLGDLASTTLAAYVDLLQEDLKQDAEE